jgi:hypothetical protein
MGTDSEAVSVNVLSTLEWRSVLSSFYLLEKKKGPVVGLGWLENEYWTRSGGRIIDDIGMVWRRLIITEGGVSGSACGSNIAAIFSYCLLFFSPFVLAHASRFDFWVTLDLRRPAEPMRNGGYSSSSVFVPVDTNRIYVGINLIREF